MADLFGIVMKQNSLDILGIIFFIIIFKQMEIRGNFCRCYYINVLTRKKIYRKTKCHP